MALYVVFAEGESYVAVRTNTVFAVDPVLVAGVYLGTAEKRCQDCRVHDSQLFREHDLHFLRSLSNCNRHRRLA